MGYFCRKFCHQDHSKIAESGHTVYGYRWNIKVSRYLCWQPFKAVSCWPLSLLGLPGGGGDEASSRSASASLVWSREWAKERGSKEGRLLVFTQNAQNIKESFWSEQNFFLDCQVRVARYFECLLEVLFFFFRGRKEWKKLALLSPNERRTIRQPVSD